MDCPLARVDGGSDVFVAYIQQPSPQAGMSRLEVFREACDAIAFLRSEYERFLRGVPDAAVQEWGEGPVCPCIAAGVIRTDFTSWSGRVVRRCLDWHSV